MTRSPALPRDFLVFVLVATIIAATSTVVVAAEWHASDRFGVVREPIAEDEVDDYEYAVLVDRSGAGETQTLHFEGEPIRRTVLEYAAWNDVEPRLTRRVVTEDGEAVATEHFRYWADGSLRSVRTVGARGTTVEYRYLLGRLHEEWVQTSDTVDRTTYDRLGRILGRTRWEAGEIVERETRTYWGESAEDTIREISVVVDGGWRRSGATMRRGGSSGLRPRAPVRWRATARACSRATCSSRNASSRVESIESGATSTKTVCSPWSDTSKMRSS